MNFLFWAEINEFLNAHQVVRIIIDAYLALLIISFAVLIALKYKKALRLLIIGILITVVYIFASNLNFEISSRIYGVVAGAYLVICFIILAPEIRRYMEYSKGGDSAKKTVYISSTQATKEAIVDAVFDMASNKVGALITIEQHISLDQYAEKAITLNSDISRELLEQIFIKDSPLHDGGVIIRGNKIVCAAAYYTLTQDPSLEKTTGSRHRAGVGISELTDSLTIIVSEETGDVHVAAAGFMNLMNNKTELLDYITIYLGN